VIERKNTRTVRSKLQRNTNLDLSLMNVSRVLDIPGGCLGFLPSTVSLDSMEFSGIYMKAIKVNPRTKNQRIGSPDELHPKATKLQIPLSKPGHFWL